MADVMEFPKYWEDFIKDYSFKDDQHIYTNGSELIPVSRVMQMVEHYFSTGADAMAQAVEKDLREPVRKKSWVEVDENNYITQDCLDMMNKAIENYNKGIVSGPVDLNEAK